MEKASLCRLFRQVTVLAAVLLLAGPAMAEHHEPEGQVHGRAEFLQYCASCHGEDGKGEGPVASSLKIPPPDLTTLVQRHGGSISRAKVAEFIDGRRRIGAHGSDDMPVWGKKFFGDVPVRVPETERRLKIDIMVRYLLTIQREE